MCDRIIMKVSLKVINPVTQTSIQETQAGWSGGEMLVLTCSVRWGWELTRVKLGESSGVKSSRTQSERRVINSVSPNWWWWW